MERLSHGLHLVEDAEQLGVEQGVGGDELAEALDERRALFGVAELLAEARAHHEARRLAHGRRRALAARKVRRVGDLRKRRAHGALRAALPRSGLRFELRERGVEALGLEGVL